MSPPATTVFAVPELLENILLKLPPLDLLLAQRVNKTFRDQINSSIHIQRKLFFKKDPALDEYKGNVINPFLSRLVYHAFPHCGPCIREPVCAGEVNHCGLPDYSMHDRPRSLDGTEGEDSVSVRVYCNKLGVMEQHHSSKHVSWRRMLVAQRPLTITVELLYCSTLARMHGVDGRDEFIDVKTLEGVVDALGLAIDIITKEKERDWI